VEPFSDDHALPAVSVFLQIFLFTLNCDYFFFGSDDFDMLSLSFLQDHQSVSSLPLLPEGGDVSERALIVANRKKLLFAKANPQILRKVRILLKRIRRKYNLLTLRSRFQLRMLLLLIRAREKGTLTKKIPERPSFLNQLPKNFLPKNRKTSTPSPLLATLARKLFLLYS
jgi:hypothetical protein